MIRLIRPGVVVVRWPKGEAMVKEVEMAGRILGFKLFIDLRVELRIGYARGGARVMLGMRGSLDQVSRAALEPEPEVVVEEEATAESRESVAVGETAPGESGELEKTTSSSGTGGRLDGFLKL